MAYSSKYYDPEKAHEYYMRTRELKGYENRYGGSRGDGTSTASTSGYLSDSQRKALKDKQHNQEIQNRINSIRSDYSVERQLASDQNGNRAYTSKKIADVKNEILQLQASLKGMNAKDRKANAKRVKQQVKELREKIKNLRYEQEVQRDLNSQKKHEAALAKKDAAQRLRQQTKGGSTSGFNEKGKAAASYIKQQMETERKDFVKKTNSELDEKMLSEVTSFANHIKKLQESGNSFDSNKLLRQINDFSKRVSKAKADISRRSKSDYVRYYKDEIDKLRSDDSMFTYWDKREQNEKKYAEARKGKEQVRNIRYGRNKSDTSLAR